MAKWIYEKWSIKWGAFFTDSYGNAPSSFYKIDIMTMDASSSSSSAQVGEVGLQSLTQRNAYMNNSTIRIYIYIYDPGTGLNRWRYGNSNRSALSQNREKNIRQADVILEENTVPDNGIASDGYWYVKVKLAFPNVQFQHAAGRKSIVAAEVVTETGRKNIPDISMLIGVTEKPAQ